MKTLFVSLAFFLYADATLLTTETTPNSTKENAPLKLTELIDFKNGSTQSIAKAMNKRNWVNTTEENIKEDKIDKDDNSWKSGKTGDGEAYFLYSPMTGTTSIYAGAYITYIVTSKDEYNSLINQAQALEEKKKVIWCKDAEHDEFEEDNEQHVYNNEYNIFFTQSDEMEIFSGTIQIFGKKK